MESIEIPQPIPSEFCFGCDVCCRFPERDSFLSPFLTEQEVERLNNLTREKIGVRPVPPSEGAQILPIPGGDGFRCPFFAPETNGCGIYEDRPFDCRLYPYTLMLDPTSSGIWLGIDTKCPATDHPNIMVHLAAHAGRIWETSMTSGLIDSAAEAPRLVGPYQPDVLPLFRLEELTAALLASKKLIPWRSPKNAFFGSDFFRTGGISSGSIGATRPLTLEDRTIVEGYLRKKKPRLAAQSFAVQFMAGDLTSVVWCETEGFLCLWAFDNGTVYMPLPPLGSGDFRSVLPQSFTFMDLYNRNPGISRIENLTFSDILKDDLVHFRIRPGYPDYVYKRQDLVELRGRGFRGKRSDWHAFAKRPGIEYRPYQLSDGSEAQRLFDRWQAHRMSRTHDPVARKLLEDSRAYHGRALLQGELMGLTGRVIDLDGKIVAYTFGVPLTDETFVVALEATDPGYRGASAYIFREFSQELEGFRYINLMDDSGLPGLRRLKRSYHPSHLEPSFVLYRR